MYGRVYLVGEKTSWRAPTTAWQWGHRDTGRGSRRPTGREVHPGERRPAANRLSDHHRLRQGGGIARGAAHLQIGPLGVGDNTCRLRPDRSECKIRQREDGVADIIDIAIVGGGPAGLTAAIYGARARSRTVVFETGLPGGQIVSASWVENYTGFPDGISCQELGDLMYRRRRPRGAHSAGRSHPRQRVRLCAHRRR